MSEAEDRTQTASKQRRQQAREQGQVAQSPELTGAVGLLVVVVLLGFQGDNLAAALIGLVREPFDAMPAIAADPTEVVTRLRHQAVALFVPLGLLLAGFTVAAIAAHQIQVGGLWVPGLLAPNPARLWTAGRASGGGGRGIWAIVKTAIVLAVAAWAIRAQWAGFQHLAAMETPALARASGEALRQFTLTLAVATLALGLIDFAFQHRRYEALLRMTPDQHREDQRAMEGDPAIRAQRRRLARTWRGDAPELLAGASLVLTGANGLTLVLAGGPPPRKVSLRSIAQGASGLRLRRSAEAAGLPALDHDDLCRRLARRRAPALPLPAEIVAELAAAWPVRPTPTHA